MKKTSNKKELIILIVMLAIVLLSVNVLATDSLVLGGNGNGTQQIDADDYKSVQQEISSTGNNPTVGNGSIDNPNDNNNSDLPQTGIEDYNIGILIIICIASAIFAYKKINYYKNV